jgi:site-specific DNA-methyltransferase (adenine-specific)
MWKVRRKAKKMDKNTKKLCLAVKNRMGTPQEFFYELDKEFAFTLDPCADSDNHKCDIYFTKSQDGLKLSWLHECVFCNPIWKEK